MKYDEIKELALEVGDVMTQEYFKHKENISDSSNIEFHKKGNWVIKRLDNFTEEQLVELITQTWQMAQQGGNDLELYSSLLSLRSMCVTVLALKKSERVFNAQ